MSKDQNETLGDIVATWMPYFKKYADPCNESAGYDMAGDAVDVLEQIVEAVKRERIRRDKTSFHCGDCALFGNDCDAGDVDGNEDCIPCEKFVRRQNPRPVRNCDRFRNENEALFYYQNCVQKGNPGMSGTFKFVSWLFAPCEPEKPEKKE